MNILVLGDIHIKESAIDEINAIVCELVEVVNESVDQIVILGDLFDSLKMPTNKELEFGFKFTTTLACVFACPVRVIDGNHGYLGEIQGNTTDSMNYLTNVLTTSYDVIDNIYFGHKCTEKSNMYFGAGISKETMWEVSTNDLSKYKLSFLGHQHDFQQVTPNIVHLGSLRYCSFGEKDENKRILLIKDSKNDTPILKYINLKSPIKYNTVFTVDDMKSIDRNSKLRFVYTDLSYFKDTIDEVRKLGEEFLNCKIEKKFANKNNSSKELKVNKHDNISSIIKLLINTIDDKDTSSELTSILKKNGLI